MKCKDAVCNIRVDAIDKQGDVIFAYRKANGSLTANEFAGCFDLGSVDYLYITEEKGTENETGELNGYRR